MARRPRHRSRNSPSRSSDPDPLIYWYLLNPTVNIWGDDKGALAGAIHRYLTFKQQSTAYRNEDGVLVKISPDYDAPPIIVTSDIQKDDGKMKEAVIFWCQPENTRFLTDQLAPIIQALADAPKTEVNPVRQVEIQYPASAGVSAPRFSKFTVTCQLQQRL